MMMSDGFKIVIGDSWRSGVLDGVVSKALGRSAALREPVDHLYLLRAGGLPVVQVSTCLYREIAVNQGLLAVLKLGPARPPTGGLPVHDDEPLARIQGDEIVLGDQAMVEAKISSLRDAANAALGTNISPVKALAFEAASLTDVALTVKVDRASQSARKKIEAAGGSLEVSAS